MAIFIFSQVDYKLYEGRDLVHFVHSSRFPAICWVFKITCGRNKLTPERWTSTPAPGTVPGAEPPSLSWKRALPCLGLGLCRTRLPSASSVIIRTFQKGRQERSRSQKEEKEHISPWISIPVTVVHQWLSTGTGTVFLEAAGC